jgi:hypothetical protein
VFSSRQLIEHLRRAVVACVLVSGVPACVGQVSSRKDASIEIVSSESRAGHTNAVAEFHSRGGRELLLPNWVAFAPSGQANASDWWFGCLTSNDPGSMAVAATSYTVTVLSRAPTDCVMSSIRVLPSDSFRLNLTAQNLPEGRYSIVVAGYKSDTFTA